MEEALCVSSPTTSWKEIASQYSEASHRSRIAPSSWKDLACKLWLQCENVDGEGPRVGRARSDSQAVAMFRTAASMSAAGVLKMLGSCHPFWNATS